MLSILIPTYNYDSSQLVYDLYKQASEANISFEIILADDGSRIHLNENRAINKLKNCRHIELTQNKGRSAIRNFLSDEAKYPHLLFLDGDMRIHKMDFINTYIKQCANKKVVVGGCDYDLADKRPEYSLRNKYGSLREANISYNRSFMTANFLITKDIIARVRFDESIEGYGYEDMLMGVELEKEVEILHISNPARHCGLDNNQTYLEKVKQGLNNLHKLHRSNKHWELTQHSKLLNTYVRINKWYLRKIIATIFKLTRKPLTQQLCSANPSLFLFDLYKLGYICTLQ